MPAAPAPARSTSFSSRGTSDREAAWALSWPRRRASRPEARAFSRPGPLDCGPGSRRRPALRRSTSLAPYCTMRLGPRLRHPHCCLHRRQRPGWPEASGCSLATAGAQTTHRGGGPRDGCGNDQSPGGSGLGRSEPRQGRVLGSRVPRGPCREPRRCGEVLTKGIAQFLGRGDMEHRQPKPRHHPLHTNQELSSHFPLEAMETVLHHSQGKTRSGHGPHSPFQWLRATSFHVVQAIISSPCPLVHTAGRIHPGGISSPKLLALPCELFRVSFTLQGGPPRASGNPWPSQAGFFVLFCFYKQDFAVLPRLGYSGAVNHSSLQAPPPGLK